jgi:hypothetical protein
VVQNRQWRSLVENTIRQSGATLKNEHIGVEANAKEYVKVQKRTILYIFVHLVLTRYVSITSSEPLDRCHAMSLQKTLESTAGQCETRTAMIQQNYGSTFRTMATHCYALTFRDREQTKRGAHRNP